MRLNAKNAKISYDGLFRGIVINNNGWVEGDLYQLNGKFFITTDETTKDGKWETYEVDSKSVDYK